jgi:hypothetical protein
MYLMAMRSAIFKESNLAVVLPSIREIEEKAIAFSMAIPN